jgi:drug/metabolite transporter (DMT)-like permease
MENIRGIALMILSMAGFSVADMFVKGVSDRIPVGEVLLVLGLGGAVIFAIWAKLKGEAVFSRDFLSPLILLRSAGEVVGTFGFVTALALTPLSSASTILQATPLAVTLGAALFLQEAVGWRRWSAIVVGFFGVLIIIRPGLEGFQPASLFAVLSVVGLSVRDLATRAAPKGLSSIRLGTYGFAVLIPVGLGLLAFQGGPVQPDTTEALALLAVLVLDVAGYYALTLAMRMGDVAIITPFRYVRIVFAISLGYLAFGESLDFYTAIGAAIIIGSGLYTFARERRRRDTA